MEVYLIKYAIDTTNTYLREQYILTFWQDMLK